MPEPSPDGNYVYYVQTWNPPSPLWRVPASGGASEKVLDGVLLANFVVLERGIYYIDLPSGQGASQMPDAPPRASHHFSTSISRPTGPPALRKCGRPTT
jgi:hypothetical protein